MEEVEEIAVGEFRVSLPSAVGDKDADLVEIEALSVRKVAFDLGGVVFEPEAGVAARADGGVERGRIVEAADVGEVGRRLLRESWSRYQSKDEDEYACHSYSWLIATVLA
jgi:hypothetical protein